MSTEVQCSKSKKKKNSTNIIVEVLKEESNYPTMEKKILVVIRGIEKFLAFLSLKPFLIWTDCKTKLVFVKKN